MRLMCYRATIFLNGTDGFVEPESPAVTIHVSQKRNLSNGSDVFSNQNLINSRRFVITHVETDETIFNKYAYSLSHRLVDGRADTTLMPAH